MREIKYWGGSHGDEKESAEYATLLAWVVYRGVHAGIVNRLATLKGVRHITENQSFAHPGDILSDSNEQQEAARVKKQSKGYDGIVDGHTIRDYGLRTAYIDKERGVSPLMLGILRSLGMHALVLTDGWGIQAHEPNAMLLEHHFSYVSRNPNHKTLAMALDTFANDPNAPTATVDDFSWYTFAADLHVRDWHPFNTDGFTHASTFTHLQALPDTAGMSTRYADGPLHILNWRKKPLDTGYWGEAVTPIAIPSNANWPADRPWTSELTGHGLTPLAIGSSVASNLFQQR